jgi:hypothetical protein
MLELLAGFWPVFGRFLACFWWVINQLASGANNYRVRVRVRVRDEVRFAPKNQPVRDPQNHRPAGRPIILTFHVNVYIVLFIDLSVASLSLILNPNP